MGIEAHGIDGEPRRVVSVDRSFDDRSELGVCAVDPGWVLDRFGRNDDAGDDEFGGALCLGTASQDTDTQDGDGNDDDHGTGCVLHAPTVR